MQSRHLGATDRIPPHLFFLVSAVFHYLGPAFAVLLFVHVTVLGVAWLRIASAALIFAIWRRPWRFVATQSGAQRRNLLAFGVTLGLMNACFVSTHQVKAGLVCPSKIEGRQRLIPRSGRRYQ